MYRQGLGDCFLITFTNDENKKHNMLIDCGVIMGTNNPSDIMTKVAIDIKNEAKNTLDTVVITHEHWDHISGFSQAKQVFDKIDFKEVWLAWTEDPENTLANKLREERENKKKGVAAAFDKMNENLKSDQSFSTSKQVAARNLYLNALEELKSFNGELQTNGNFTTTEALQYVKTKGNGNIDYLTPGLKPITIENMDGIRFYILGPPQDEKLLKKDLSKKETYHAPFTIDFGNSYLSALLPNNDLSSDKFLPFDKYIGSSINVDSAITKYNSYYNLDNIWRTIDNDWLDFSGQLALALDSDTNNTSLVLAIEIIDKEEFLLFTGDAQVGNWLSWYSYNWKVKNKNGEEEEFNIEKIFERTVFYKVGHHGSHNATLSEKGLDKMNNKNLIAMIPVNKSMAKIKHWKMPFPPLFEILNKHTSGRILEADEDFNKLNKPQNITKKEWNEFANSVDPGTNDLYIDYSIDCKK